LLLEQFIPKYNMLREKKLYLEADNLLIPVSNWRLDRYLIRDGYIDFNSADNWVLRDCNYSKEIGLEIS
jgi:hypothetical protein